MKTFVSFTFLEQQFPGGKTTREYDNMIVESDLPITDNIKMVQQGIEKAYNEVEGNAGRAIYDVVIISYNEIEKSKIQLLP